MFADVFGMGSQLAVAMGGQLIGPGELPRHPAERFKRALSLDPGFDDARRLLAEALTALSAQRPAASPR